MRLSLIAAIICALFVGVVAACGGDDDATGSTSPTTSGQVAPTSNGDGTGQGETVTPNDGGGDDDGGTDDEYQSYFEDLEARFEFSRNDSDDATATYNTDLADAETLDEQKEVINTFLETMLGVFDDSILTMNGFDPPADAEEAHFAFRDRISEAEDLSETLIDDLEDADTEEAVNAVVAEFNSDVSDLVADAQAECRDLQELADDRDIDVDLECNPA